MTVRWLDRVGRHHSAVHVLPVLRAAACRPGKRAAPVSPPPPEGASEHAAAQADFGSRAVLAVREPLAVVLVALALGNEGAQAMAQAAVPRAVVRAQEGHVPCSSAAWGEASVESERSRGGSSGSARADRATAHCGRHQTCAAVKPAKRAARAACSASNAAAAPVRSVEDGSPAFAVPHAVGPVPLVQDRARSGIPQRAVSVSHEQRALCRVLK